MIDLVWNAFIQALIAARRLVFWAFKLDPGRFTRARIAATLDRNRAVLDALTVDRDHAVAQLRRELARHGWR